MGLFSADEYVAALAEAAKSELGRRLLAIHYAAPEHTVTATQMSAAAGHASPSPKGGQSYANRHYGALAAKVGAALGWPDLEQGVRVRVFATFDWPEGEECHWVMHPELAVALERLGWVSPPTRASDGLALGLLKLSGRGLEDVLAAHAVTLAGCPADWGPGVRVLLSKNRADCGEGEKQIAFVGTVSGIRPATAGSEGSCVIDFLGIAPVEAPFDLQDVIGPEAQYYAQVRVAGTLTADLSQTIGAHLGPTLADGTGDLPEGRRYPEGACKKVLVNAYERDERAREACLARYDARCSICEFDFAATYGDLGRGYIHVHHKKPLSEIAQPYEVDPINDLIPVCANCHAMIHRRQPALSPDDVRAAMRRTQMEGE
jgi:hypothetical protein